MTAHDFVWQRWDQWRASDVYYCRHCLLTVAVKSGQRYSGPADCTQGAPGGAAAAGATEESA